MTARRLRVFASPIHPGLWRFYCPCCGIGWHAATHPEAIERAVKHARWSHTIGRPT